MYIKTFFLIFSKPNHELFFGRLQIVRAKQEGNDNTLAAETCDYTTQGFVLDADNTAHYQLNPYLLC